MKDNFQLRKSFLTHLSKLKQCLTAFSPCLLLATKCLRNISCSNLHWMDNDIRTLTRLQEYSRPINPIHDSHCGTAYRQAKWGVWWQVLRHSQPYKPELPFCSRYKIESNVNNIIFNINWFIFLFNVTCERFPQFKKFYGSQDPSMSIFALMAVGAWYKSILILSLYWRYMNKNIHSTCLCYHESITRSICQARPYTQCTVLTSALPIHFLSLFLLT